MRNLWFISNRGSGSTSEAKCEAIEAVFEEHGLCLAGRTWFPDDPLPNLEILAAAEIDTIVLFAGDGTINAALCALADWDGAFLILPGGTMNMLASELHAATDPREIIRGAHQDSRKVALPYVEAGPHKAFVALILGPAGSWFRAREQVRNGRFGRLVSAVCLAWRRSFNDGVRVSGLSGLAGRYQAIFITPAEVGIAAAAVDARDWASLLELGWDWLTGDWVAARSVTKVEGPSLRARGRKPTLALFDGEPQSLSPGTRITRGITSERFISTRAA